MADTVKIGNTTVTPILLIDEAKPIAERLIWGISSFVISFILFIVIGITHLNGVRGSYSWADVAIVIVLTLLGFFRSPGRNKFYLCEEGLGFPGKGGRLYRWNELSNLVIKSEQMIFQMKTPKGILKIQTRKKFEQAKQILEQHLSPKQ
jgi:hypothetical protein